MGVSQSKGVGVHWLLEPLVPRSWAELEQLHLRFQQEAHRRRADPTYQYFLPFPVFQTIMAPLCPDKDKLQLLAMFEVLDRKKVRKLAAMDFFSGLALLVEAKKPQKLDFVLSLLDNGGLKTVNRCELAMVVAAAARGLTMFAPGAEVLSEATMKPLIRRLFGEEKEVLRQIVTNKALADPEILFFMSDLEAGVATSSGELLVQQAKLLTHMAYIDYQAARVKITEESGKANAVTVANGRGLQQSIKVSVDSFLRKLQAILCPPPPKGFDPSQSMRVISPVEVRKHVDTRTLQRLVSVASDRGLSLAGVEADTLLAEMAADQFGFVRGGDVLRVMKAWVKNQKQETPEGLWEIVGNYVVDRVKRVEQHLAATLAACLERTTMALGHTARHPTAIGKEHLGQSLLNRAQRPDTDDSDIHWNATVRVGESLTLTREPLTFKRVGGEHKKNIRFRLGIHPPVVNESANKSKSNNEVDNDNDDAQPEEASDSMRLDAYFLLSPDMTDEEGIDLASSMERAIQQELVWAAFESLWTKCSVTIHSAVRSEGGTRPTLAKLLRVCIYFRENLFSSVEECTGTSLADGIRKFFVLGELDQSLGDIVKASQNMAALLRSLGKRTSREKAIRMIFEAFASERSKAWRLQEFNAFQQAVGKEALGENVLANLFNGASTISWEQFMAMFESYSTAKLLEIIHQLGIGSLGNLVTGSVSITSVVNESCIKALDVLLSPLRWADAGWKKLLFFLNATKDVSIELLYPQLAAIQQNDSNNGLGFLWDPLLVASWVETLEEFVQPAHSEHFKDRPCRSIICSLERETSKTQQQLEFDDQSKKLPRGISSRRATAMVPFLEVVKLLKTHVRGPELLEICSNSIRIVVEVDNFVVDVPVLSGEDYMFLSEESKVAYLQALEDRHDGKYQNAVDALERIIEVEGDSEKLWIELALTQFQLWEAHVRALHMPSILDLSAASKSKRKRGANGEPLHSLLLQEAYSTFLIAMEYPASKSNPELLLPLARLYIEFGSYRGALSVCTLVVEGYPTSPRLNEAIFLSALTASAMGRHRESAQYFQYLADSQGPSSSLPFRLAIYQLALLAALELAQVSGMRALERETYAQAYKAMLALPPVLLSEKTAHNLHATSRKNVEERTRLWYRDVQTWLDLAQRLAGPANSPLLVLAAIREARRKSENRPIAKLLLEGVSLMRIGDTQAAEGVLAEALLLLPRDIYYSSRHERFLLESCSSSWRARFIMEHKTASRLQAFLRRRSRLIQWHRGVAYVLELRRHAMALRMQCAWRCFVARRKLTLLREEQRQREILNNKVMAKLDDRAFELFLNTAALKIQSLLQISRDRRTIRALRAGKIEREALLLRFIGRRAEISKLGVFQRWWGFSSGQKQERVEAIVTIQRCVRCWRFRKRCFEVLQLRQQQNNLLQACLVQRATTLRSRVFKSWHNALVEGQCSRDKASRLIQRRYRSRLAVRQFKVELHRHRAAIATMNRLLCDRRHHKMSSCWRALSSHAIVRRLRKRGAAVTIQKRVQGMLARQNAKRLRTRRRRAQIFLRKLTRSRETQNLQAAFDKLRQHVEEHHYKRWRAATIVQTIFRGFRCRQRIHHRRKALLLVTGNVVFGARLKGQPREIVLWACLLALARCINHHKTAVLQLQAWWRHHQKRTKMLRVLRKRAAQRRLLGKLQQSFHTLARSFFRELRQAVNYRIARQNAAATKIQGRLRCWLMRRRYLSSLDRYSVAAQRGEKAAQKLALQRARRILHGWRNATRNARRKVCEAACVLQRTFRQRRAQRQARAVVAKKAAQARLLASVSQKPLERCFRQWEATVLLEKSVLRVRSSSMLGSGENTPSNKVLKPEASSFGRKLDKALTLEERAEVPSVLYYTLLNRVRQTGICQLSYSLGTVFKFAQLRQLITLSTSIIVDSGGGLTPVANNSPLTLNEQVVVTLEQYSSFGPCPVQSLILCNAPLRPSHASLLAGILQRSRRSSNLSLVSVVLANVHLSPSSVVSLACALAQSPSCLQQLVLERCQVGSAGAAALFEALVYNRSLWKLDLSGNNISDSACPPLARALLTGTGALRVLVLSRNDLSDRGVLGYLAPALASSQLETLVLLQSPRLSALAISALRKASSDLVRVRVVSEL